jgi:hypothetical protein
VATVAYVGSKGTHLSQLFNLNQLVPLPLSQDPFKPGEPIIIDPNTGENDCTSLTTHSGVPITGAALDHLNVACTNVPATQSPLLPFPGYANISRIQDTASSTYHALQTSLRRTAGKLQLNASYTWSHAIDNSSDRFDSGFVDSYNLAANRASSNFDERHIFNLSYVYDLPFFTQSGLSHTLLGGWQWSGITTFSTGTPFSVLNGVFSDNAGVGNAIGVGSFADKVGDPKANVPNTPPQLGFGPFLFNPAAFAAPRGLTFGDSGRNSLRNPNHTNFDMGLFKHFNIRENIGAEFRAEAFNVFNHTEWGYFGGGAGSAASNSGAPSSNTFGNANFLQIGSAHNPRILQLALKLTF